MGVWQQCCYDSYSTKRESREAFESKEANSAVQFKQCSRPWVYQTAEELNSSPKWGYHAWYGGGGYSADLGYEEDTAYTVIDHLQSGQWVDRQTRAIIVEFNIFNPAISALGACSFFFELLQTGQATALKHIDIISLHNTDSILQVFQGLSLIIFIAMVFFKTAQTMATLVRQGRRCLCCVWYWLDLVHLVTSISLLVVSFFKSYHISQTMQELQRNIFATINFQTAVLWGNVENCILAVLTFLTTVKLLQLTYFNMYTRIFSHALRIWMRDLFSFLVVLAIIFFAFLQSGILLFGSQIGRYSSFWPAFSYQLEIVLGKVKARPIKELVESNFVLGYFFVVVLLVAITIILMNLFISSLNDAVGDAKTLERNTESKHDAADNQPDTDTSNLNSQTSKLNEKQGNYVFFNQISDQLKTIDLIHNLPQAYTLDKKLTEVLKLIDVSLEMDGETTIFPAERTTNYKPRQKTKRLSTILEEDESFETWTCKQLGRHPYT